MRHDYDVFERFPDGSTLWRTCVAGRYEAQRKIHELKERSDNEFFLMDVQEVVLRSTVAAQSRPRTLTRRAVAG